MMAEFAVAPLANVTTTISYRVLYVAYLLSDLAVFSVF